MSNYGYYLPLHPNTFETARYIGITPKTEGFGGWDSHWSSEGPIQVVVATVIGGS